MSGVLYKLEERDAKLGRRDDVLGDAGPGETRFFFFFVFMGEGVNRSVWCWRRQPIAGQGRVEPESVNLLVTMGPWIREEGHRRGTHSSEQSLAVRGYPVCIIRWKRIARTLLAYFTDPCEFISSPFSCAQYGWGSNV